MDSRKLAEGEKLLAEKGMAFTGAGASAGNSQRLAREYLDSLCLEMRVVDAPAAATTRCELWGESFASPVVVTALSALDAVCPGGMVEVAKAAAKTGTAMLVGIGGDDELAAVVDTGAKAVKIVKPYRDADVVFRKLEQAGKCGAFGVGMDVSFGFGMKNGFAPAPMAPKTLDEIKRFVAATPLPFLLKGVLSASDAQKALDAGVAGIMVSHQGGTVMDFAVPPLRILPRIAELAQGRVPVLVDCSIQTGTDVFKALALGADGVGVGKAVLVGLAASGADGVRHVLESIAAELRRTMSLTGAPTLSAIDRGVLWE